MPQTVSALGQLERPNQLLSTAAFLPEESVVAKSGTILDQFRESSFIRSRVFRANQSAIRAFDESSLFSGGHGCSAPPVFQQKPGMQLFFFRKTSSSARKSP
jgi:hypothetical protein